MLFELAWQKGTGGSTQPRSRISRENRKAHEPMKGLFVVVTILLAVRWGEGRVQTWGRTGIQGHPSVSIVGIASEVPLAL